MTADAPDTAEVALRLFCVLLARNEANVQLFPSIGENQIRTCFALADTFLTVAREYQAVESRRQDSVPLEITRL